MLRIKLIALALGLSAPLAPLHAQQIAPPITYETFQLDNGLTFIVHEDHSTPIVAIDVWYDVGSAHEPAGRSGFAHFFEHLLFQETGNMEKGDMDRLVSGAGGNYNGTTNNDRTLYFQVLPSNRLNLGLWIEAERMARLRVTQENFDREREVVKEERRLRIENAPYMHGILTLDTLSADWAPYQHTVIGTMDDLNAASVEDVYAFYREYYVPNNSTITIAGDVTVDQVRELAEEYFAAIPRGPDPPPLPPLPATPRTDGERRVVLEDKLANLPLYNTAFNIPAHRHDDTYALTLLSSILSRGESSRLHQRLVKEEEAAVQVGASLNSRLGPGMFMFQALPNQGVDVDRIETLIDEEIAKVRTEGVTALELEKAVNQQLSSSIMGRQTVLSKAEALQHARAMHGDLATVDTDIDEFLEVTLEDIRRVATTYLVPENRTVVIVMPAPAQPAT